MTSQGALLDDYDDAGRERGTGDLRDKLGASLRSCVSTRRSTR